MHNNINLLRPMRVWKIERGQYEECLPIWNPENF